MVYSNAANPATRPELHVLFVDTRPGGSPASLTRQRRVDARSEYSMADIIALVDAAALRYLEITGRGDAYERLDAERQAFRTKVSNHTATMTDVLNHVLLIDNCGYEVDPTSEGMAWLREHTAEFVAIVGDADVFVETVLHIANRIDAQGDRSRACTLGYTFFKSFLGSHALMATLSPAWRERMVREVFPRFGTYNKDWIAAAVQTGVPRKAIADAILARLADPASGKGYAHGFLTYGRLERSDAPVPSTVLRLGKEHDRHWYTPMMRDPAPGWEFIERHVRERLDAVEAGRPVPKLTYQLYAYFSAWERPEESQQWRRCFDGLDEWSVLLNTELETALITCAELRPEETLAQRAKMLARLSPEMVDLILSDAVDRLTSVSGIPETEMALLSLGVRKRLAERLVPVTESHLVKPTAQFLFRLLGDLPTPEERRALYEGAITRVLADAPATDLYRAWRQLGVANTAVENRLSGRLAIAGYWVGTIEVGPHPKGGAQAYVRFPGKQDIYVEQRGNGHRYVAQVDDLVMFRPDDGTRLTPRVVAVTFVPVMTESR